MLFCKSSERARRAVYGRVANTENCQHDDCVEHRRESFNTGILNSDYEGRGHGISTVVPLKESRFRVRHEQADERQRDDVEERDAPEDLLDGGREGFSRVGGFGRGKTDELGTGEGEGGVDEGTTEALEAIVEGARVFPILATNVATIWSATNVDDDTEDDEPNDGGNLDDGEYKLCFAIPFDAEQVDGDNEHQKYGYECMVRHTRIVGPVLNGEGGCDNLEWKDDQPL